MLVLWRQNIWWRWQLSDDNDRMNKEDGMAEFWNWHLCPTAKNAIEIISVQRWLVLFIDTCYCNFSLTCCPRFRLECFFPHKNQYWKAINMTQYKKHPFWRDTLRRRKINILWINKLLTSKSESCRSKLSENISRPVVHDIDTVEIIDPLVSKWLEKFWI